MTEGDAVGVMDGVAETEGVAEIEIDGVTEGVTDGVTDDVGVGVGIPQPIGHTSASVSS